MTVRIVDAGPGYKAMRVARGICLVDGPILLVALAWAGIDRVIYHVHRKRAH